MNICIQKSFETKHSNILKMARNNFTFFQAITTLAAFRSRFLIPAFRTEIQLEIGRVFVPQDENSRLLIFPDQVQYSIIAVLSSQFYHCSITIAVLLSSLGVNDG